MTAQAANNRFAGVYSALGELLAETPMAAWAQTAAGHADAVLANPGHGDFPRWAEAVSRLPEVAAAVQLDSDRVSLGAAAADQAALARQLMELHPWRKGPIRLGGQDIDTEWRSDWKWARLAGHVDLQNSRVLDIGCGNGYYGWRMLGAGAQTVVGIDPTLVFVMQWLASRHFAPTLQNFVLPMKLEDLPPDLAGWDAVFSMGVLYHRREPREHLQQLRRLTRPGGTVVLETLVVAGPEHTVLAPRGRYARMPNVWYIPSSAELAAALGRAGFTEVQCVDETTTSVQEQRSTRWMRFESLAQCLDPGDPGKTIEGYPAPVRAVLIAR